MRLTPAQILAIRDIVQQTASAHQSVRVFGSRLDDAARGGDLDLLVEFTSVVENPALLSAQLSAKISRVMHGRKVDVLLSAPNLLHLPIHDIAFQEGAVL
ncbi:MAG: hypothetical protein RL358_822 [Pseudomonadota bacterium]|jgi:predicted nucleotidyltransferase